MTTRATLLAVHEGCSGPFIWWLEKLGLGDFLKSYPLTKLVEWGWVVPQYRVIFPREFFDNWDHYPSYPCEVPDDLERYSVLWSYSWRIDSQNEPLWFLDPIFHPSKKDGCLLRQSVYKKGSQLPTSFEHSSGRTIFPYVDYFYPWQGYALIDLVRFSDIFDSLYLTPEVVEKAKYQLMVSEQSLTNLQNWPVAILSEPKRWGGLGPLMTWLDHFRAYRDAFKFENHGYDYHKNYCKGAELLAGHLGFTASDLAIEIKEKLLVLANEWFFLNTKTNKSSVWTIRAWPYLQENIQLAITWLLLLTGKTFEELDREWRQPYRGNWGWLPLDSALPYEFFRNEKRFVEYVPIYLAEYNKSPCLSHQRYDDKTLPNIISKLKRKNYPFIGFLSSFDEIHKHLSYRDFDKYGLDFRELRPLDHYALLAIRAEGCLRREVEEQGLVDEKSVNKQGLLCYIRSLSKLRGLSLDVINSLNNLQSEMTKLHSKPCDPIGRIIDLNTKLQESDEVILKAFLCCLLARNYFAHHDFLDGDLSRSDKSQYMLRGILLTVLILLDD